MISTSNALTKKKKNQWTLCSTSQQLHTAFIYHCYRFSDNMSAPLSFCLYRQSKHINISEFLKDARDLVSPFTPSLTYINTCICVFVLCDACASIDSYLNRLPIIPFIGFCTQYSYYTMKT